MKKLQKFALSAIFISALTLGFASCSDDKNEDENLSSGKMLPSKITIIEDGEIYAGYILTYNSNNQLIKYTDTAYPEEGDRPFKYDDKGRLVQFDEAPDFQKWTFIDDSTIEFTVGGDSEGRDNASIKLNDKGVMSEFKGNSSKFASLYTYDTDNNVLTETSDDKKVTCTYHKEFSPFCNTTLPSYFMLWDDNFGIQTTGKHMPKLIHVTKDIYTATTEYTILESKDNYPTKIEEKVIYIANEEGEKEEPTIYTYNIEYQEMK